MRKMLGRAAGFTAVCATVLGLTTTLAAPAGAATTTSTSITGAKATYNHSTGRLTITDTKADGRRATVHYRNVGQAGAWYIDARNGSGTSASRKVGPGWWFEMQVCLSGTYKCGGWKKVYG